MLAGDGSTVERGENIFQRGSNTRRKARGDLTPIKGWKVLEFRRGECSDQDCLLAKQIARRGTQQVAVASVAGLVAESSNDNKGRAA